MKTFPASTSLESRILGALLGGAIGDGMGAPVEGWGPQAILARYDQWDFTHFLPKKDWDQKPFLGKGNGRITDDTLMVEAIAEVYIEVKRHLDAYDYANLLLPRMVSHQVFLPEWQKPAPIFDRLWIPEKYPRWRIEMGSVDPRSAGIGNMVNCGVAMWIMPVGAVNPADPYAAYQEACAIGAAHNESFAVEAAGVLAAAHASAMSPASTIENVITTALSLARDGTLLACQAAVAAADPSDSLEAFIAKVRQAVAPFDQRTQHTSDDQPLAQAGVSDIGRPSRTKSIEELPVAFAALKYGGGDFLKTLRASVCYGRDCDSIASMACGLLGAIHGTRGMPASLIEHVSRENRRDFFSLATRLTAAVREIQRGDTQRCLARQAALGSAPTP